MRYQSPDTAAPDIETLVGYLSSMERAGERFIYRGQVKEWPGPLLPSLYRHSIRLEREFTPRDAEYQHSLRQCGRHFIEMKPDSSLGKLILDRLEYRPTSDEWRSIVDLSTKSQFAALIASSGFNTALVKWIRPEKLSEVLARCQIWKTLLDHIHRGMIRHLGFVQPFGYMLGMTLAQQYGFSSELLDFTSDAQVAAFFATHDGPHYRFEGSSLPSRLGSDIGVIYRLPSTAGTISHQRLDDYNYYTCPTQIHLSELCIRFEDKSSPEMSDQFPELTPSAYADILNLTIVAPLIPLLETAEKVRCQKLPLEEAVDRYLMLYYDPMLDNTRYYRLLDLEPGTFARSRLGRQSAVVIVPDELRVTERGRDKFDYATFQAIEDVSQREGFERFYFYHSQWPAMLDTICREYLWPSEGDCFKTVISRVLDPSTTQYWFAETPVPKRFDLVSSGFTDET